MPNKTYSLQVRYSWLVFFALVVCVFITLPVLYRINAAVVGGGAGAGGWKSVQSPSQSAVATVPSTYGAIWTPRESNRNWFSVASSADGSKLVAVVQGGKIYTSTDSGVSWTPLDSDRNWYAVASSADGTKLVAVVNGGQIYTSIANSTPTITPLGQTSTAGSPIANVQVATVNDADEAANILQIQISSDGTNFSNTATLNGVTVSLTDSNAGATGINPNSTGQVFADVIAACGASNGNFTLKVTDSLGTTGTATLTVTVSTNTPPVLSYNNPAAIVFGMTTTVYPASGPSDNGNIVSFAVQSKGTFTGNVSVNSSGVVSLSNAAPIGTHTITIRATDNCNQTTDATFMVTVSRCTDATLVTFSNLRTDGRMYRYQVTPTSATLDLTFTHPDLQFPHHGIVIPTTGDLLVSDKGTDASGNISSFLRFKDPLGAMTYSGKFNTPDMISSFWLAIRNNELFVPQVGNNMLRFLLDANGNLTPNGIITDGLANGSARGIVLTPWGELFVTRCCGNDYIVRYKFDANGNASLNGMISGNGLSNPHGMAFSSWGELFVASHDNNTVSRFTFDANRNASANGQIINAAGLAGIDVAFSPWGELFISNNLGAKITRFKFDNARNATFNGSFDTPTTLHGLLFLQPSSVCTLSPPTVTTLGVTSQAGSPAVNAQLGTAIDSEDAEDILQLQISSDGTNFSNTTTLNGVTVTLTDSNAGATGINPNAAGQVFADVVAACGASNASFTLKATDSGGEMATATLTATVTTNTPPMLGNYQAADVSTGANTIVTPNAAPSDNSSVMSITAAAAGSLQPPFTGLLTASPTTGVVTITDAKPAGAYTVTVTATDNCGLSSTKTFTLMVTNPSACSAPGFTGTTNVSVGTLPLSVAVGDFNGDGKQDLAAANQNGSSQGSVSIRLGDGLGGFSGTTTVNVGPASNSQPSFVAVGDFNGDGKQDLAVANRSSNTVSIRLGDGAGNFSGTTEVSVLQQPQSMAVGDFNGDGKQDLAVGCYEFGIGSNVPILLGDGAGNFSSTTVTAGTGPVSVAVGDFNGDGKQDLVVANYGNGSSNTVSIRLGDGAGNFSGTTNISVGSSPIAVAVGDFNGDGKQDLAVANQGSNTVSIRLGDGAGNFSGTTNVSTGTTPSSVALGDFNGDGKQDFATANYGNGGGGNTVSIRLGDGLGSFSGTTEVIVGSSPTSVAVGDFNGDSKQDFATANFDSNTASIRLGICNFPPTITAGEPLTRQQGAGASNSTIATASDAETAAGSLTVTVTSANPSNGVTVSNIVNTNGTITADIVADCTASNASFTLQVSDGSLTATAPLNVTVTPDVIVPTLGACPANIINQLAGANCTAVVTYTNPTANDNCGTPTVTCTPASGSSFALGTTTVSCVAKDAANNMSSACTFTVQVVDTTAPTLGACPTNITNLSAGANCTAVVTYTNPTANDNCGTPTVTCTPASGSSFALGTTTVSCVAKDAANNMSATCTFTVQVVDTTAPTLGACPANIVNQSAGANCTAAVTYTNPSATDNCGTPTVTCTPASGSSFALGTTTVSCVAKDAANNMSSACTFTVQVVDTAAPTLGACPTNITQPAANGLCSAVVSYTPPMATDNCGVQTVTCSPASGSSFNLGVTTVTCTPRDAANNVGTACTFTVTINDAQAPTIAACTPNISANTANDQCAATVTYTVPTATDNCARTPTVTCSPASGSSFAKGTTTVTCTATDAAKNSSQCAFTVTVTDGQNPTITCPANQSALSTNGNPIAVTYPAPTASDNCAGMTTVCVPASGSSFVIGTTTVNCTATDAANRTANCSFTVTVNFCVSIVCPADVSVVTTATARVVNYSLPTSNGTCGTITCSPASGSSFAVGVTTVNCASSIGNQTCAFQVTVNRISGSANDPLVCTGPGNTVQATLVMSNNGNVNQTVTDTTTFTNLVGVPNSCVATPNVGSCTVTNGNLTYGGTLTPGQTVTLTYLTQVSNLAPTGAQVCTNNSVVFSGGPAFEFSVCDVIDCPAIGPGNPTTAGSVLVYNVYTSSTDPTRQNTRLNITNTHSQLPAFVHLFFVAEGCSVADSYVCLTPNQTTSFLASDLDPGTTGYVVAVAVDARGCPINFNYLIGDEYAKFASGHAANLTAEAFAAIPGGLPACDGNSVTAALNFDGVSYNRLPAVLALSNVGSRADGNDTLLILNRIGGNLGTGASSLGTLFGILYDDAENALSFSVTGGCQFRSSLTNNTPRTTPRFETFIPAGRTGWLKVFNQTGAIGMTGAAINFNANSASSAGAFNQGHNLHALTLNNQMSYVIPVFPPSC